MLMHRRDFDLWQRAGPALLRALSRFSGRALWRKLYGELRSFVTAFGLRRAYRRLRSLAAARGLPGSAHRALRLFVAAGITAAGVCLVIGSVVIVASATAPGKAPLNLASGPRPAISPSNPYQRTSSTQQADSAQPGQGEANATSSLAPATGATAVPRVPRTPFPSASGTPKPSPSATAQTQVRHGHSYQVLATFTGAGDDITSNFKVSANTPWGLLWSYTCPAATPIDQLIVTVTGGTSADQPSINESGISGAGDTWLDPDGASHYLVVISTCSWNLEVVQSK